MAFTGLAIADDRDRTGSHERRTPVPFSGMDRSDFVTHVGVAAALTLTPDLDEDDAGMAYGGRFDLFGQWMHPAGVGVTGSFSVLLSRSFDEITENGAGHLEIGGIYTRSRHVDEVSLSWLVRLALAVPTQPSPSFPQLTTFGVFNHAARTTDMILADPGAGVLRAVGAGQVAIPHGILRLDVGVDMDLFRSSFDATDIVLPERAAAWAMPSPHGPAFRLNLGAAITPRRGLFALDIATVFARPAEFGLFSDRATSTLSFTIASRGGEFGLTLAKNMGVFPSGIVRAGDPQDSISLLVAFRISAQSFPRIRAYRRSRQDPPTSL